jgi:hypothetical protein
VRKRENENAFIKGQHEAELAELEELIIVQ